MPRNPGAVPEPNVVQDTCLESAERIVDNFLSGWGLYDRQGALPFHNFHESKHAKSASSSVSESVSICVKD